MSSKVHRLLPSARRAAAAAVRRARVDAGLTQEEVASRTGVAVRTLRDIENGRARMTALEVVLVLRGEARASKATPNGGAEPLADRQPSSGRRAA